MLLDSDDGNIYVELENDFIEYAEPMNVSIPIHTLTIPFLGIA